MGSERWQEMGRASVGGVCLPLQWVTRRIPCKGHRERHKHQVRGDMASSLPGLS